MSFMASYGRRELCLFDSSFVRIEWSVFPLDYNRAEMFDILLDNGHMLKIFASANRNVLYDSVAAGGKRDKCKRKTSKNHVQSSFSFGKSFAGSCHNAINFIP